MPRLRVGVVMGGKSIEKEVSFNSGRTICDHLDTTHYDIVPIYQTADGNLYILPWHFLHRGKTTDFEHRLRPEAQHIIWDTLADYIDFMYIAMHGRYGEDGILQGALELLGIPYLGSSRLTSALCMDKSKLKIVLKYHGITVPDDVTLDANQAETIERIHTDVRAQLKKKKIEPPWIVKPHNEGSSIGVTRATNEKELIAAVKAACFVHPHKPQSVLIEPQITGMEFCCVTLVDHQTGSLLPLPPTEIIPDSNTLFDYNQKYMPGRATKFTPPRCSEKTITEIQNLCVYIMQILDIQTISRIDGFVQPDGSIVIVDPNTFSGMAPSSFVFREAAEINMSHTALINHLIETDIKRYHIPTHLTKEEKKRNAMRKKIRIGVLLAGASHEREISLESGRNVSYKLSPEKYDVTPIFVDANNKLFTISQSQLVRNSTSEIAETLTKEQQITWQSLSDRFDFIFNGLHGGTGENGSVQGMLELFGIPYNGSSVFASALCMDKYRSTEFLNACGFSVPQHYLVRKDEWDADAPSIVKKITHHLPAPFIVKPSDDGCSVMVSRADTHTELHDQIAALFKEKKATVLIEEHLSGMELTVGVIGNEVPRALAPSYEIAQTGILSIEEKFLPGAGENQTPAPLLPHTTKLVQTTVEQVFKAVGCQGYARIDCFYQTAQESPTNKERVVILEINTLPGLTPATCIFHQAAEFGIKPMDFIDQLVELGFHAHHATDQITPTHTQATQHLEI